MEPNWGIAIILCFLIALNLLSLILLKKVELRYYLIDTSLISICLFSCVIAYFIGEGVFFLGIFIYTFRLTSLHNLIKYVILFGGIPLGYFAENHFYTYSSVLVLTAFTIIRLVESIIEMSHWTPKEDLET